MELNELRKEIDAIDTDMVKLFSKRMHLSKKIAQYKKENGLSILDKSRQQQILHEMSTLSGEELAAYTKTLFSTLMHLSRSYQSRIFPSDGTLSVQIKKALLDIPKVFPQKVLVACHGAEGTDSQLACVRLFPRGKILYFNQFEKVFQAVESGTCEYGVLPIENSSFGSVRAVYDLMRQYHFSIVRALKIPVHHVLLAKPGVPLDQIREVYGHEQGLEQCSAFLHTCPEIKTTVTENAAAAAKQAAESSRKDIAAISSANCAGLYGLSVLSDKIQNSDTNYTRFVCLSRNLEIYPDADKISIMLTLPRTPDSLYEWVSQFSSLGLNLTRLESRPIPGSDSEFMLYLDIDASVSSEEVLQLLNQMQNEAEQFEFFGSYREL